MKHFILISFLLLSVVGWNQSTVYGVAPQTSDLFAIDTVTFSETFTPLTSTTGIVAGCNGLAGDPCGVTYVVYRVNGDRYLGTIDFVTSVITEIGILADNIASIAYNIPTSTLYGVTGDGAGTPETLYTINTTTAAMTFALTLGNGDDGEAIAINPTDGLLYHWSGWGLGSVIMETINLTTLTVNTPSISLTGDDIFNVGAAVYDNGKFLLSDINDETLHWVTPSGVVTNTSSTLEIKGLALSNVPAPTLSLSTVSGTVICSGATVDIIPTVNNTNVTYDWLNNANVSTGITTSTFSTDTAGTFTCVITDACGGTATSSITMTVGNNPVFTLQISGNPSPCPGDSASISGGPAGGTNQWFYNGNIISGATNGSFFGSLPGNYALLHTNADGCSDSSSVNLTNSSSPNVTLSAPAGLEFCPGDSVELTVNTGGGSIQWFLNTTAISAATGNSYYATSAGNYNVTKVNMSGCSDSAVAPLQVTEASVPSVILTPSPEVNFCGPGTVELSVNSGGGSRQWYQNGVMIPGENGTTYTVSSQGVYNVIKTNTSGCSDSAAIGTTAIDTCLLSIFEPDVSIDFNVFPNPATSQITLDLEPKIASQISDLAIIGIDGRTILSVDKETLLADNFIINLSELSSGLYIIRLSTEKTKIVKELIVK